MTAYGHAKTHSMSICMSEICQRALGRGGNVEQGGALTAARERLDWGTSRPPDSRASMRKKSAARIDPTAIRVCIDVCWRFPIAPRRHTFHWYTPFDVAQMRKGVPRPRRAEPVHTNSSALLLKARLEISGLRSGSNRLGFARQRSTWRTLPMRGQVNRPERRVEGRSEGRRESIENRNWPAGVFTGRKFAWRLGRNGGAFPQDVDDRSMEVSTVRARAI